jgi:signal transduction histidine kinase
MSAVTKLEIVDRLAQHKVLGGVPREELEWIASHGKLRTLSAGEVITAKGAPVENLFIFLSGHAAIFINRGAGLQKMIEWKGGDVGGLLPYSRLISPPADSVAQESTEILCLHRDDLRAMTRDCYEVTCILVHAMVDRSRAFTFSELHDEKMMSLGKLSAGLAHELNNPASAIERSAALLEDHIETVEQAARALGMWNLSEEQFGAINSVRESCRATNVTAVLSPLQRAEREETMSDWLSEHHLDLNIADTLAESQVTFETLDRLASSVEGPVLEAIVRWSAASCSVRKLADDIQHAAMRISGLVSAIKGFTHMDQAPVAQAVNLTQALSNTIAVLQAKAHKKSASVVIQAEPGLPAVRGFVGELNQIWANLIDNALDAIPEAGHVEITAKKERQLVLVRVIDNGPGIPSQVRDRIFEPFFTTKPMGHGTGLGLDIVRRLIIHNEGTIEVYSEPGRTEFCVALPIAEADEQGVAH